MATKYYATQSIGQRHRNDINEYIKDITSVNYNFGTNAFNQNPTQYRPQEIYCKFTKPSSIPSEITLVLKPTGNFNISSVLTAFRFAVKSISNSNWSESSTLPIAVNQDEKYIFYRYSELGGIDNFKNNLKAMYITITDATMINNIINNGVKFNGNYEGFHSSGIDSYIEVGTTRNSNLKPYFVIGVVDKPTITGLRVNSSANINLEWQSTYQDRAEITLLLNGNTVKSYSLNSSQQNYSIPRGDLTAAGDYSVKVKAYNAVDESIEQTVAFTMTPSVSNIELNQLLIDNPFIVSWRSEFQTQYELEIYQNNIKIKTYSANTTTTNRTIPAGEISKVGSTSFRLRVGSTVNGLTVWSSWVERNFNLTRIIPRITNFNVLDNFFEKDIRTNWRGENQSKYEFEILKDNTVVKQFTGNTENNFTIPTGTLASGGDYTFRVRPVYVPTWSTTDLSYGEWVERNVKLVDIVPTISNLSLSGSNIDLALTASWESTDQSKYELEVYKDSQRVDIKTGTTEKSITYPYGTFSVGLHKFRIRVAYTSNGADRWTDWKETNATLVETVPSIGVLEPDGVIVDRDSSIRIWWTSTNQSKWKITIDDSVNYEGTTQTEHILSSGVLQTGKHKIGLVVTYITPNQIEKTVSKKAEFIVQGKPPLPSITSGAEFTVSRPTITWDTQEQQGYRVECLKGNKLIYDTDWQNGLVNRHKIMDYLEDGAYIIRIRTKNQFNMESDYSTTSITINTSRQLTITLNTKKLDNAMRLVWNNLNDGFEKFYVIRNGDLIANVGSNTEYIDYTCNKDVSYIIRGIMPNDVYIDSNVIEEYVDVKYGIVAAVSNLSDIMNVGTSRNEYRLEANIALEHELVYLSGREFPVSIFGEHSTNSYSFKFNTRENLFRFLEMCMMRQVFCYRDKRQTLYLSIPNPTYSIDKFGTEYSVQATRVDYSEVVDYD